MSENSSFADENGRRMVMRERTYDDGTRYASYEYQAECRVTPTPSDMLNGLCGNCRHALVIHDREHGCIICDYLTNISPTVPS